MERYNDVSCEVVRTRKFLSLREIYLKIKEIVISVKKIKNASIKNSQAIKENSTEFYSNSKSGLKKVILSFLWLPDDQTGWVIPAVIKSLKLIKKNNIKTVMTTSPPHSTQIIGLLLKKITHCRWVVDFRDPWCPFPGIKNNVSTNFFDKVERWLEKKVIENADVVILNTDVVRQRYVETFTTLPPHKFVTIPNGFDISDFKIERKKPFYDNSKFILSYIGEFYFDRNPEVFLKAISELIEEGIIPIHNLKLRFIGKVRNIGNELLSDIISELGLSDVTEIIDTVPHSKAIEYMLHSKVLLVFSPQNFMYPAKVFEYMASGAYIIAFTPPGALADIVKQYSKGIVVSTDDVEDVKKAVLLCYEKFIQSGRNKEYQPPEIEKSAMIFERKNLTKRLSEYL